MGRRPSFTKTQKRDAVLALLAGKQTVSEVCRELGSPRRRLPGGARQCWLDSKIRCRTRMTGEGARRSWSASSMLSARSAGWRWRTTCWKEHRGG